jgi:hypothetical protein
MLMVPQDSPLVVAMLEGVFQLFTAKSIFLIASFPPLTTLSSHYCAVSASFGMTYSLQHLPQDLTPNWTSASKDKEHGLFWCSLPFDPV